MHLTVISSIKKFLLPAMPTSAQDYTTSYVALMHANVEAAVCVVPWHTTLMSVANTGLSLTSDLIFLTVVSNVCGRGYLLEICKIPQISFPPQNTGTGLFYWKLELCHGLMPYSGENPNNLYVRCPSQAPWAAPQGLSVPFSRLQRAFKCLSLMS